jgi:hypothetical protein
MDLAQATSIARKKIEEWEGEWPEDDWFGISEDWDLNIYSEDPNDYGATLYRVHNGNTDTSKEFIIKEIENV